MISVTDFGLDANKFLFGKICKKGHEYESTGLGLRRKGSYSCFVCSKDSSKAFHERNKKRRNATFKEKYDSLKDEDWFKQKQKEKRQKKDKAKVNEYAANWRKRNPERAREVVRNCAKKHRETTTHNNRKRRALKKQAVSKKYSLQDTLLRFNDFNLTCAYCQCDLSVDKPRLKQLDHFIPLKKGGFDAIENLIPACISCNSGKRDRIPHEWYEKQPFYSKERWNYILSVLGINEYIYELMVESIKLKQDLKRS